MRKMIVCILLTIALSLALLSLSGCTVKFKGTDVDYEGTMTKAYQFDGLEFAHAGDSQ